MIQKLKYGLIGLLLGVILFIPLYSVLSSDMREISPWYQSGTSVCLAIPGSKVGIGTSIPLELLSLYGVIPSISLFDSTHSTLHSDWKIQTYSPANPQEADTYLLLGYNVGATPSSNRKINGLPCAQLILEPQYFYGGNPLGTAEWHWDVAIPANGAITWITPFFMNYNFNTLTGNAFLMPGMSLGIRTTTPSDALEVKGAIRVTSVADDTQFTQLSVSAYGFYISPSPNVSVYYDGDYHIWKSWGVEKMRMTPTGFFGIGTTIPPTKLFVAGVMGFGSYTNVGNYEYGSFTQTAGALTFAANTLGTGTDDIDLVFSPAGIGVTKFMNTVANDVTACLFTAASGPVGANVAIQGWLKIKDSGGTVRFIPYW